MWRTPLVRGHGLRSLARTFQARGTLPMPSLLQECPGNLVERTRIERVDWLSVLGSCLHLHTVFCCRENPLLRRHSQPHLVAADDALHRRRTRMNISADEAKVPRLAMPSSWRSRVESCRDSETARGSAPFKVFVESRSGVVVPSMRPTKIQNSHTPRSPGFETSIIAKLSCHAPAITLHTSLPQTCFQFRATISRRPAQENRVSIDTTHSAGVACVWKPQITTHRRCRV
ncbi:uncharacterized protein EKO05_0009183 [Ascochyta rabiei]|uniref:uncharacterized protein n=1 Tax=Didymella rabiei TaxID=5454 RepID=UPI00220AF50C|nr:uncharacterized protein EKO05_0009183 [Ascochyta rabiei]UPX18900.1 hypothetical protein EKO05_0009183 [Ascochyta rabiei]